MGRRIRWLALGLVLAFALVLAQVLNIQQREATRLNATRTNPRNVHHNTNNKRGLILAANGLVLAKSVHIPGRTSGAQYYRTYGQSGIIFSGIVGFSTPLGSTAGVEHVYDNYLSLHTQPVKTLGQLLNPPKPATDDVHTTVVPDLQELAAGQFTRITDTNRDGAIVVLNATTGAVLAMASNPAYTNNVLATPDLTTPDFTKGRAALKAAGETKDHEGFLAYPPLAYWDALSPGSTFKVVTSTAVYNLKPTLAGFTFTVSGCTGKGAIPGFNQQICNDATTSTAANPCGGMLIDMLPESCDPAFAMLGLNLGPTAMVKQASLFGYNSVPPIDEYPVATSHLPPVGTYASGKKGPAELALVGFGQGTVFSTVLQGAMVAQGIADTGKVMTPHVVTSITDSATGALVKTINPSLYQQAATPAAAQMVNKLMQLVVQQGTAGGVGFPSTEHVAVKTGTAQEGSTRKNIDWMIGFAPATAPRVAIAVAIPTQPSGTAGATVAGPIFKTMMSAALAAVPPRTTKPAATTPITGPTKVTDSGTHGPPTTTTTTPGQVTTTTSTEQSAPSTSTTSGGGGPTSTTSHPTTTTTTHPPPTTTTAPPTTTTTAPTSGKTTTTTTAATTGVAGRRRRAEAARDPSRWRWARTADA